MSIAAAKASICSTCGGTKPFPFRKPIAIRVSAQPTPLYPGCRAL
jgi:hypothetical protein